jgi:adenylyltransferase/sulfurtransferase
MDFTENQLKRYARHIVLPEVGGVGQAKIVSARVLVVGAGGLGAPLLLYLAAAGIGRLGVVDDDVVDLTNLQRQVIHATDRVGRPKVESARETIANVNPEIAFVAHNERLGPDNVLRLIADYDVVADGSDNFATRYLLNDACHFARKALVSASILRFEGQISTFKSGLGKFPCYRCLYPSAPPPGRVPTCAQGGVLGALAGTVGSIQATEVLKEVMGIGDTLAGSLILYDALSATFRKMNLARDPACALCGDSPTIRDLAPHRHEHAAG